jgi:ABC-type sugar transport system ATPase subunit
MPKEILRMEAIGVTQDGNEVLKNAWMNLFEGEILGMLGLNDSGKSAMLGVLAGYYHDYAGKIFLDENMRDIPTCQTAANQGIVLIQRGLSLFPNLSVTENIFITRGKRQSFIIRGRAQKAEARKLLSKMGVVVDETAIVSRLTYYQRFLIELCRAVNHKARIIAIDGILSDFSKKETEKVKTIFSMLSAAAFR